MICLENVTADDDLRTEIHPAAGLKYEINSQVEPQRDFKSRL